MFKLLQQNFSISYKFQQTVSTVDLSFAAKCSNSSDSSSAILSIKLFAHAGTIARFHKEVKYLGSYALPQICDMK
ncbi:MAG: hypothetical protein IKY71_00360 [Bacteroidaceae bacterium]|nr:hypothetical protein [Bacteroidaceae bacterium]